MKGPRSFENQKTWALEAEGRCKFLLPSPGHRLYGLHMCFLWPCLLVKGWHRIWVDELANVAWHFTNRTDERALGLSQLASNISRQLGFPLLAGFLGKTKGKNKNTRHLGAISWPGWFDSRTRTHSRRMRCNAHQNPRKRSRSRGETGMNACLMVRHRDSPFARLQGSEGVQRPVHPGEVPELHVVVVTAGDQTSAGRIQSQSWNLYNQTFIRYGIWDALFKV